MKIDIEAISIRKERVKELERKLRDLSVQQDKIRSEILIYENFSITSTQKKIETFSREIEILSSKEKKELERIAELESTISEVSKLKCSPLVFWKYLSSEQTKHRAHISILEKKVLNSKQDLKSHQNARNEKTKSLLEYERSLKHHTSFDITEARRKLEKSKASTSEERSLLDHAKTDLSSLETKLAPHLSTRERITLDIRKYDDDLLLANKYNSALDKASDDAKARREIHKQCEDYFGDGKPYKVIDDITSKKQRASRDLQKIDRRISDETRKHEMEIDTIIIDGNNVCYSSGNEFIGLSAVRPLAHSLSKKFSVTVVFDASIRKLLKANTQDIQKNLGREVSTYVAPNKNAADEYILKLAEGNDRSYIITNDRYSEWHDYDAVRESRAINFLIANNRVMINDLDITIDI